MSCERCTDPDGYPCFPVYGLAPHDHKYIGDRKVALGYTTFRDKSEWPENFIPDPEAPNSHGTYFCPECGDGDPRNEWPLPHFYEGDKGCRWGVDKDLRGGYRVVFGDEQEYAFLPQRYTSFRDAANSIDFSGGAHD